MVFMNRRESIAHRSPYFLRVLTGGVFGKLRWMKSKPLTALAKAGVSVERLAADCVHGTGSCKCARLDSDQVRAASIEGGFHYLICSLD